MAAKLSELVRDLRRGGQLLNLGGTWIPWPKAAGVDMARGVIWAQAEGHVYTWPFVQHVDTVLVRMLRFRIKVMRQRMPQPPGASARKETAA